MHALLRFARARPRPRPRDQDEDAHFFLSSRRFECERREIVVVLSSSDDTKKKKEKEKEKTVDAACYSEEKINNKMCVMINIT